MNTEYKTESQKSWEIRNNYIEIPSGERKCGYKNILLVGKTGAGKTSLVRQFLGEFCRKQSFPPTSPSRTTVADFEAIFTKYDTEYKCIVTFHSKKIILGYIKECILDAARIYVEKKDFNKAYECFLTHSKQEFSLKFVIGDFRKCDKHAKHIDYLMQINNERGVRYKQYIISIANYIKSRIDESDCVEINRNVIEEIIENLSRHKKLEMYCNCILNDILSVIVKAADGVGELQKNSNGWPIFFRFRSLSEGRFINVVKKFYGNSAKEYGSLVTPIINGIRISGPFCPSWTNKRIPKIVIFDGQGVGHRTTDNNTPEVLTSITDSFSKADAILVVDTASSSMLGETQSVVKSVVTHGYSELLRFVFTKFDTLEGDNFYDNDDKINHVLNPIRNFSSGFKGNILIGDRIQDVLAGLDDNKYVFLSNLHLAAKGNNELESELYKILNGIGAYFFNTIKHDQHDQTGCGSQKTKHKNSNFFKKKDVFTNKNKTDCHDLYIKLNFDRIREVLLAAIIKFHNRWDAYLNLGSPSVEPAEHWTRIKALNRRIAIYGLESYDTLRPIADICNFLQDEVFLFLKENKIDSNNILKEIAMYISRNSRVVILDANSARWQQGNDFSGPGSTKLRSKKIKEIYDIAMPKNKENIIINGIVKIVYDNIVNK